MAPFGPKVKVLKQKKKLPPVLEWGKNKADPFADKIIEECIAKKYKALNLTNLKLIFNGKILGSLPTEPWPKMVEHLQSMELDNHYLTTLPREISVLRRLKLISIQGNQFTSLPEAILNMPSLIAIRIGHNPFEPGLLPDGLAKLKHLRHIEAAECNLTGLPETFKELKMLEKIDLSDNSAMSVFPEVLCSIPTLTVIKLNGNKIVSIPEGIGSLKLLKELSVMKNKLKTLPVALAKLTKLTKLHISGNSFKIPRLNELAHEDAELLRYIKSEPFVVASAKCAGVAVSPSDVPAYPATTTSSNMEFMTATANNNDHSNMSVDLNSYVEPDSIGGETSELNVAKQLEKLEKTDEQLEKEAPQGGHEDASQADSEVKEEE